MNSLSAMRPEPTSATASGGGGPPSHIAIIMDGNRRWARGHGMPVVVGHQRGAGAVRRAVEGCRELGVRYLTLYAFSSENWKRSPAEVNDLMNLLRFYIRREIDELERNGVRARFIGEHDALPGDIVELTRVAAERTRHNTALTLTIALNYGARREIVLAARRLAAEAAAGRLDPETIDEPAFARALATDFLPDPDLLIRTSGEQRLSNFLLWQMAYTELVFLPVSWPDFDKHHLRAAIVEFNRRERRYGASAGG
ncbi:MAG TPA: isoprenyl transferase [Geminicoccaceae bacterium]|nr:isoprenyl transferase [Geminicoccaceae bacterium]